MPALPLPSGPPLGQGLVGGPRLRGGPPLPVKSGRFAALGVAQASLGPQPVPQRPSVAVGAAESRFRAKMGGVRDRADCSENRGRVD